MTKGKSSQKQFDLKLITQQKISKQFQKMILVKDISQITKPYQILLLMHKEYRIIGMMSGTSLDGIDLAFCHFVYIHKWQYNLIAAKTYPYTSEIINDIKSMQSPNTSFLQFKKLQIKYSLYLSQVIREFIRQYKLQNIDFLSLHGHTIFHQPQEKITVQIANLSTVAAQLKLNVIGNFRQLDVMNGGQGAPLAPFGQDIFGGQVYLNFGGIANIGYRKKGWDINFCNLVFNHYAQIIQNAQFDIDGKIGKKGKLKQELKEYLSANFSNKEGKSLGRQGFQRLLQSLEQHYGHLSHYDILHTFYIFLTQQIVKNVKALLSSEQNTKQLPFKVICTGGGAKNKFLFELLTSKEKNIIEFTLPNQNIIDFKEAILFAYLGLKFMQDIDNCNSGIGGILVKGKVIEAK